MATSLADQYDMIELARLLLEDVCSDLVRFLHSRDNPTAFAALRVDREYALGQPGAFADLRVEPGDGPPYFMEVKHGYDSATMLAHLTRKYAALSDAGDARKLILVVDTASHADWPGLEAAIRAMLPDHLSLEVWDEACLHELTGACFGSSVSSFSGPELVSIREKIDVGKDRIAFGEAPAAGYAEANLRANLIWHFGTWRMRELRHATGTGDLTQL